MPSNLPSSFASAAAGQNANRDARGGGNARGGVGSSDWTRRDGRPNGTLTFRRTSTAPGQPSQTAPASAADSAFAHTPVDTTSSIIPSVGTYDIAAQSAQYGKKSILDLFGQVPVEPNAADVLETGWNPGHVNGSSARGWGKSGHTHINQDPGSCWLSGATNGPNGSRTFTIEEKEAFLSDVNSPLKPPNQKDGNQAGGVNGRKTSMSQGTAPGFGVTSPGSASRPGTRRRETVDPNPFASGGLSSPASTGRFSRDADGNFSFSRRDTESKDQEQSDEEGAREAAQAQSQGRGGLASLLRSQTSGNAPVGGSNISSLWGQSNQPAAQPLSAGGGFGQFAMPTPTAIGGGARGGSRFANLIPKDSSENVAGKPGEASGGAPNPDLNRPWRARPRTDTDPFGDDGLSGSAALGGAKDTSPPPMPNPATTGAGVFETPIKGSTGDFGMAGLNLGHQGGGADRDPHGPVSPSETNPYRSPPADRGDDREDQGGNPGPELPSGFAAATRSFPAHSHPAFDGSDRSQTSSAGPKGYGTLSGLTGWPAPGPSGTPDRERQGFASAFGSSLFNPIGADLQSPGLQGIGGAGTGGMFGPPSAGGVGPAGSIGRSKLGSLFPPAMQAQMQGHEHHDNLSDSIPDLRQSNPLGAIGRSNFGPQRDSDGSLRSGRGVFEELFPSSADNRSPNMFGPDASLPGAGAGGGPLASQPQSYTPGTSSSAELPSSQVRQMVMPDRMRWVYLDPQGHVQGPFTGLEMNDWYKANFFTADLRVKKVEDPDFEPLGQLIRRIGNSREPFLVPQIGVPHGPPAQTGPFSPATPGGVVPPLSGLFPSYGRTLTAEEQNNLERRKQEEQFAMAQQREIMMRQQAISRIQQPGGVQGSLHHHASAHSLQSQPSFGSITSPIGAPQQQQPPVSGGMGPASAGFFEGSPSSQQLGSTSHAPPTGGVGGPGGPTLDTFREDDLANLNATERQMLANVQGTGSFFPPQPIGNSGNEGLQAQLRSNLPGTEQLAADDEGFRERLREFEGIRAERDSEQQIAHQDMMMHQRAGTAEDDDEDHIARTISDAYDQHEARMMEMTAEDIQMLSLTQQVQKTQAAAAAQNAAAAGLPMPFPPPPPQSGTPLPAPTAQRARSNLPEQYSRSQSGTPDASAVTEPPPLAPWAKETGGSGGRKGPSLKEIQEVEARNAAKAEEAAAAIRRAALEQEAAALREREKAAAVASGLPTSSTWGNGSPVPATGGSGSPWSKPGPAKAAPGPTGGASKQKTLADIQREEEARKEKVKAMASQSGGMASIASGKRYADLATRPGNPPGFPQPHGPAATASVAGSGWATVGAGGKVKVPTGPASQVPSRSASANHAKPPTAVTKPMPKQTSVGTNLIGKSDAAMDEFNKWLHRELSRGITGVDIESFAATLMILPLDAALIADAVYANSKTMNGQHFAEEFVRRKKRADQGIIEKQPTAAANEGKGGSSASGWNEVAKKGGSKDASTPGGEAGMQAAGFKVVPGRKKGSKKG